MRKVIAIMLVTLLVSTTLWARGAYKWIDDNGVVHYSDRMRGDGVSVINVHIKEPDVQPSKGDKAADDKVAAAGTDARAAAREKKIREENCAKARQQLETNQGLTRMYRVIDGERHYLSEKERDDVIQRSRDAVTYWCQ